MDTTPRCSRFWSLLACSALALCLLLGRVLRTGSTAFVFLAWNLTLAWVPFACSAAMIRWRARKVPILFLCAGGLWLLFLPNAPYLVTDLMHLRPRTQVPLWYDVSLLSTFAWCGMLLATASLELAHRSVREIWGGLWGWLFVGAAVLLSGLGVYLGRFHRWNSWDLLLQPGPLLADLAAHLLSPVQHARAWMMSAIFGTLLLGTYLVFVSQRADAGAGGPAPRSRAP